MRRQKLVVQFGGSRYYHISHRQPPFAPIITLVISFPSFQKCHSHRVLLEFLCVPCARYQPVEAHELYSGEIWLHMDTSRRSPVIRRGLWVVKQDISEKLSNRRWLVIDWVSCRLCTDCKWHFLTYISLSLAHHGLLSDNLPSQT